MSISRHAIGIVITNRWDLTQKTLQSLYHTDQSKDSYDLFIIDNGSSPEVSADIKRWVQRSIVPVKNLITLKNTLPIGPAWNLFLGIAREYAYRTKLDNDLIFANTPVVYSDEPNAPSRGLKHRPGHSLAGGTNPGATPVASFQMGAGCKARRTESTHTCFLDHLEDYIKNNSLGISALVPVPVGNTLSSTLPTMGETQWRQQPCLVGKCMMISKSCFDKIGYFDERLPSHIDFEYSQRAMGEGINIGYVNNYCVIDIGKKQPTLPPEIVHKNNMKTKQLVASLGFSRGFMNTKWTTVYKKIESSMSDNVIVNLT